MYMKFMNSKLLYQPKTCPNLKFCFITRTHRMTLLVGLWSQVATTKTIASMKNGQDLMRAYIAQW